MVKIRKSDEEIDSNLMDQVIDKVPEPLPIDKMPLNTFQDYMQYNAEARKHNRSLRMSRYQIKQIPIELHPQERVVFGRNDQPLNPLKVYLSDHMIHFDKTLHPGQTYDLPVYVVDYLSKKGNPVWKWFQNQDGSKETRVDHYTPRFALRTVYAR